MSIINTAAFEKISHKINFQNEGMPKGIELVNAGHVQRVQEITENHRVTITALVIRQTSVTKPPYRVTLVLNNSREVTHVSCQCVYNKSFRCKHIAALIHFINTAESLTKTNYEQQWGKPSLAQLVNKMYSKGADFDEMFPAKRRLELDEMPILLEELEEVSGLRVALIAQSRVKTKPISSVPKSSDSTLSKKAAQIEDCKICIENFLCLQEGYEIYTESRKLTPDLEDFYNSSVCIAKEQTVQISCNTIDQSQCREWFTVREPRVSASSDVHKIITRKRKTCDSLASELANPKNFFSAACQYGIKHEPIALREYERTFCRKIVKVGVLVSAQQPSICASIDGAVIEDGCILRIVEVKCPSSCEKLPIVDRINMKCNAKCLEIIGKEVELKQSHMYYTQCQIQMYVTGVSEVDLYLYSPVKSECVRVLRDEVFLKDAVLKCEEFYFSYYLPKIRSIMMSRPRQIQTTSGSPKRNFTGEDIKNTGLKLQRVA